MLGWYMIHKTVEMMEEEEKKLESQLSFLKNHSLYQKNWWKT
jgi:hypothetical protein